MIDTGHALLRRMDCHMHVIPDIEEVLTLELRHEPALSAHDRDVACHFDDWSDDFYIKWWSADHVHFGLFEEGESLVKSELRAQSKEFARGLERMIEVIVAPAMIERDHHVVDAGCGTGGTAIHLARTRGCVVTGVNVSTRQLETARKRANEAGLEQRVGFEYGNFSRSLPIASDSVDVVVNIESACHCSDRGRFLREVRRILKPGGRIAASDWLMSDGLTADRIETYIRPMYAPWALQSMESPSTYIPLLRDAGLTLLEFEGFSGRDVDNPRLLRDSYRVLKGMELCGLLPARARLMMEKVRTLEVAWRNGCFELGRYCAVKPE